MRTLRSIVSLTWLAAAQAFAHGVPPQATSFTASPDGTTRLAGVTFGALINTPPSTQFSWVCEEAIGFKVTDSPVFLVTDGKAMFSATLTGLFVSRDTGCSWTSQADLAPSGASDITTSGNSIFVTSARYGVNNGVWKSSDDGVHFVRTPVASTVEFYSGIRVAPSRPQRIYVSAWYFDPRSNAMLISDDTGSTFTRVTTTTALPATGPLKVLAVDPMNADIVYATVSNSDVTVTSWFLRSVDGGHTFSSLGSMAGAINSAVVQGSTVYVAGADRLHLFDTTNPGAVTETTADSPKEQACAMQIGSDVYTCGNAKSDSDGYALARVNGAARTPVLTWPDITGPLACPESSPVSTLCAPVWSVQRLQLNLSEQPQVVAADNVLGPAASSGCNVAPLSGIWAIGFVGLLFRRRRVESR